MFNHYFDVEIPNTDFNVAHFVQNPAISFQKINKFHKYYETKVRQLTENIHNNICILYVRHQNYDDIIFKSNQQRCREMRACNAMASGDCFETN